MRFADWVHNRSGAGDIIDPTGFGKSHARRRKEKRETAGNLEELGIDPGDGWQERVANNPNGVFDEQGYTTRLPGEHIAEDIQHLSNRYVAARNDRLLREAIDGGNDLFDQAQGALNSGIANMQTYRAGGGAAMMSGLYQAKSAGFQNQAGFGLQGAGMRLQDAPDLMFKYNEAERDYAREEARSSQRLQFVGSLVGGIGGGGGGGGDQAAQAGTGYGGAHAPGGSSTVVTGGGGHSPGGVSQAQAGGGGGAPMVAGAVAGGGSAPSGGGVAGGGGYVAGAGIAGPGAAGGGSAGSGGSGGVQGPGRAGGGGEAGTDGGGGGVQGPPAPGGDGPMAMSSGSPVPMSAPRAGMSMGISPDAAHLLGLANTLAAFDFKQFQRYATEAIDSSFEAIAGVGGGF